MKSISINYNAHRVATEKDNYDPLAHEKREKKLKEDREKKQLEIVLVRIDEESLHIGYTFTV